jgi:predicted 3-demethylubiquinone-9 3-methyltransferase (glyoxalase superfamily)
MLLSPGPYFKLTPAVSILVACKTREQVEALWRKLS